MSVIVFCNLVRGVTGLDKSVLETCNLFAEQGIDTWLFTVAGRFDGLAGAKNKLHADPRIHRRSLKACSPRHQPRNPSKLAYSVRQRFLSVDFDAKDLQVLRELEEQLSTMDTILFAHPLPAMLHKLAVGKSKARTVLQIHGNYHDETHNMDLLRSCMDTIDILQVVAKEAAIDLCRELNLADSQVRYIPNIHSARSRVSRGTSPKFRAAIVGSLQERKNQADAIRCLEFIDDPDVVLDIWGPTGGAYYDQLVRQVEKSSVASRVHFRGYGTEEQIYQDTDVVVMTSKSEGFGYILLEAATHCIPAVVYDFDYGPRTFIDSGQNGYIVSWGNAEALAQHILELKNHPQRLKSIGMAARETFEKEFSRRAIFERYQSLLDSTAPAIKFPLDGRLRANPPEVVEGRRIRKLPGMSLDVVRVKLPKEYLGAYLGPIRVTVCTSKHQWTIPAQLEEDRVLVKIPLGTLPWRSATYSCYLVSPRTEEPLYLFTASKTGVFEMHSVRASFYPSSQKIVDFFSEEARITPNGLSVRLPIYAPLGAVRNEKGESLEFSVSRFTQNRSVYPEVSVSGQYQRLVFDFGQGVEREMQLPRMSYAEILRRVEELEASTDLMEYRVGEVYIWELIRVSVIEALMMGVGNWSSAFSGKDTVLTEYIGTKRPEDVPDSERLVLEFVRKRGDLVDKKTASLQTPETVVFEYPQSFGYTARVYDERTRVFPMAYMLNRRAQVDLRGYEKYQPGYLEELFRSAFGLHIDFRSFVDRRIETFRRDRRVWQDFFSRHRFREVVIPSAYWVSGVVRAAKDHGIQVSDVQYALLGPKHPNYGFRRRKHYAADKIYIWSEYWKGDYWPYSSWEVLPQNHLSAHLDKLTVNEETDYVVVSQTRLGSSFFQFAVQLAEAYPRKSVVCALHPDDREDNYRDANRARDLPNLRIVHGDTLGEISRCRTCIGCYSTSVYEALELGKKVLILDLPGYEIVQREIDAGYFALISSVSDIEGAESKEFKKPSRSLFRS